MNFFQRLRIRWKLWWSMGDHLNRRTKVEQRLHDAANGKKDPPTREECKELARTLGVPDRRL